MRGRAALLAVLVAGLLPASAAADVDPPSDVLLFQNSYVPRGQPPRPALAGSLAALADKAHRLGYPIKVAVVGSDADLGAVPQLLGNPSGYAVFLGQELFSAVRHAQPLLVVTPGGIALYQVGREAGSVKDLTVPAGANSDQLTQVAIDATQRLSEAAGHPLGHPKAKHIRKAGGTSAVVFFLPVAALLLAGLLVRLRKRQTAR